MKIINKLFQYIILLLSGAVIIGFSNPDVSNYSIRSKHFDALSIKVNKISELISNKKATSNFSPVKLFNYSSGQNNRALNTFVRSASFLTLNRSALNSILKTRPDNIVFSIPASPSSSINLELTRVSVTTSNFNVIDGRKNLLTKEDNGIYYRGIIKGNPGSLAAISIFPTFVMGLISNTDGNLVLGSILDAKNNYTSNYILYNDRDLIAKHTFKCGVEDNEDKFVRNTKKPENVTGGNIDGVELFKDTVAVYFEADYDMYTHFNSNINQVASYISGLFNYVALLYQNENIPFAISQIRVWTSTDPYANDSDSYTILQRFGYNTQDDFMGDLAHLLSTGHNQSLGGISWINVLCTAYNSSDYSGRYSFSNIDYTYEQQYPTYSWTVMCVTHEMGHSLGSYHTHSCHWPIDPNNPSIIGAIDSCYYAEGNCFSNLQLQANNHGTIMSYCHLNGAIDFTQGFGPLPGDTIRYWFSLASCIHSNLNSSEQPAYFSLLQNYPNPFNPSTNIKFALPEEGYVYLNVYDVTGRTVARLVNGQYYPVGTYNYLFDAGQYNIASGVYFYKLYVVKQSKQVYSEVKKMVLIK